VREEVLKKAKKLYPLHKKLIENRFLYAKKALELEGTRKKLDLVLRSGNQNYEQLSCEIDEESRKEFEKLDEFLRIILKANEPVAVPEDMSERLLEIANWTIPGSSSPPEPLLTPEEFQSLSIREGSLDSKERTEIESHVTHTMKFLKQIRWTHELRKIPDIARSHHERLNGSGYPDGIKSEEIPLQSRMMAISDVFDALTAHDRPWKRAVPNEVALSLLGEGVKSELLDPLLFKLFVDAKVYEITSADHNL
jgi:hypothetical protein